VSVQANVPASGESTRVSEVSNVHLCFDYDVSDLTQHTFR